MELSMIRTSKQARRDAKQLFRLCLVDGRLDESRARKVVQGVLQSRRRGYRMLLSYFQRLLKLDRARHTANVESALPLPADLQASVRSGLEEIYGTGLTTLFAHNPALIGGMRVQVGSDVYDGSVQSGLAALEKQLGIMTDGRNPEI